MPYWFRYIDFTLLSLFSRLRLRDGNLWDSLFFKVFGANMCQGRCWSQSVFIMLPDEEIPLKLEIPASSRPALKIYCYSCQKTQHTYRSFAIIFSRHTKRGVRLTSSLYWRVKDLRLETLFCCWLFTVFNVNNNSVKF